MKKDKEAMNEKQLKWTVCPKCGSENFWAGEHKADCLECDWHYEGDCYVTPREVKPPPAPPSNVPPAPQYMDARTDEERAADAKLKSTTTAGEGVYTPPPSRAAREAAESVLRCQAIDWGMDANHCEDAGLTKEYEQDLRKRIEKLGQVADWLEKGLE